jgi:anti-sigma regulatory factor (Ser/Thr protein kinase)
VVAVVIRDRGGSLPRHLLEGGATPDAAAESGRGWHIIRAWTDTVTYAREAKENVLTLTRRV